MPRRIAAGLPKAGGDVTSWFMKRAVLFLVLGVMPGALLLTGADPALAQTAAGSGGVFTGAGAASVDADYAFYTAGLNTGDLGTVIDLGPEGYRLKFAFHTAGLFSAFVHGQNETLVEGHWEGTEAVPERYDSTGLWSGEKWRTVIDYADQEPFVRTLIPPREPDRDTVTPTEARQSLDSVSAMALLVHRVQATGRCDGTARLFDGRRLMRLSAHTIGTEIVPRSSRSPYFGPAQRCDFEGVLIGGIEHDKEEASTLKPKRGSAWFAVAAPGMPPLPIRMDFETIWFGTASMYLTSLKARGAAMVAGGAH